MIEVQALVSTAVYGTPQRSSTGFNAKRLNMLLAVLEKRAGFSLNTKDVFINITGGMNVEDPALDLAVIAAILSSYNDISISEKIVLQLKLVCLEKFDLFQKLNNAYRKQKTWI